MGRLATGRFRLLTNSPRLNQDPLENLFSEIRYNGRHHIDPTAAEFIPAFMTVLLNHVATSRGNCEDTDYILVDLRALLVKPEDHDEEGDEGMAGPALGPPAQRAEAADPSSAVAVDDIVDVPGDGDHMYAVCAGALAGRLLVLEEDCQDCKNSVVEQQPGEVHQVIHYLDNPALQLPKQQLCQAMKAALRSGREKMESYFYLGDVKKKFASDLAPILGALEFFPPPRWDGRKDAKISYKRCAVRRPEKR